MDGSIGWIQLNPSPNGKKNISFGSEFQVQIKSQSLDPNTKPNKVIGHESEVQVQIKSQSLKKPLHACTHAQTGRVKSGLMGTHWYPYLLLPLHTCSE